MSTVDVTLPDDLKQFVEGRVASHGYRDASEYLCALIEADRLRNVREELVASLVSAARGPSGEMTRQDWDEIRREGLEQIRRRQGP